MNAYQFISARLKPYKLKVLLNVFFNFLYSLLSLVSLASMVPFLRVLFEGEKVEVGTEEPVITWSTDSWMDWFNYKVNLFIQEHDKMEALLYVCGYILVAFFLKNLFRYIAFYQMAFLRNAVVRDIREDLHKRVIKLPLGFFSEEKKGDLISRFSSDVTEVEFSIMSALDMVFKDPIMFIMYLGTMFTMNAKLTLFVLVVLPISGLLIAFIGKNLRNVANRSQKKLGAVVALLEESISGIRVLKAFGAESRRHNVFSEKLDQYFRLMVKLFRRQYIASPLSEFLGILSMIVVLWFGGSQILSGESHFDGALFITFIIIFSQLITPAKKISESYFKIKKGMASAARVEEVLNTPQEPVYKNAAQKIDTLKKEIRFEHVTFEYEPGKPALNNLSFTVEKGQTVALVGTSGSGKSTIANLLPAFHKVEQGDILFDGVSIKQLEMESLRALFGIVTQESILFNDTVAANLSLWEEKQSPEKMNEAIRIANATDFLDEKDTSPLEFVVGEGGNKFSGGQRQRMSIARAVYHDPPVLILDEATSALDSESEKAVQDALTKLMENRTAIVIAHRLSTIQNADKIIVLDAGNKVEEGTHQELIDKKGAYWKFYQLQNFS